ncbi:unnamed protein product [Ilex paraguariensis]|uniref:CCHC-type domain-containing protein n=1 Tax=Ilex paraguariensis TaxID=185542 RepID=A0ABC8TS56_9AQUA
MNLKRIRDSNLTVFFKYERLSYICYYCGQFGHGERECLLRSDSTDSVKKGSMQYEVWLRAPVGRGLKNIAGLDASEDKSPTVEKNGIFSASVQVSLEKNSQNGAAVIEPRVMGVSGLISDIESVIIEDEIFKKVEVTNSVDKGISAAIIVDNYPKEIEGNFIGTQVVNVGPKLVEVVGGAVGKGTQVVNVGPKLVEDVGGAVGKDRSQPISNKNREAQWTDEDYMDIPISSLAQTRGLLKLGELGVDEGSSPSQNPIATKKWRRKEKGSVSSGQTKNLMDPNGKQKYGEGIEDLGSRIDASVMKEAKVNGGLRHTDSIDMENLTVGTGLQSHRSL